MGEHESTGLLSGGESSVFLFSAVQHNDKWATAEGKIAELIQRIQPSKSSDEHRVAVAEYMKQLIKKHFGYEVYPFGSVPLKTYLSDGDIDLTACTPLTDKTLANHLCSILQLEEGSADAQFKVKEVQYINAEVEVVKCLVEDVIVDVSFNQLGGLCTLCFLEEVDQKIGQDHLFKRSIILVKAWCYYESRILGAHCSLISTYALETMVLYIFHLFHSSLRGPLEVLFRFLEFFSNFDWDQNGLSLWGPIPLSVLRDKAPAAEPSKIKESLGKFLFHSSRNYAAYLEGQETLGKTFSPKFLNIVDPLRNYNNLGRSVNKGNFCRIRSAFSLGAKQIEKILSGPQEQLAEKLKAFFQSTEKHGSKHRPDVPAPSVGNTRENEVESKAKDGIGHITTNLVAQSQSMCNRKKSYCKQSNKADGVVIQKLDKDQITALLKPLGHVSKNKGGTASHVDGGSILELSAEKGFSHKTAESSQMERAKEVASKLVNSSVSAHETIHISKRKGKGAQAKRPGMDFEFGKPLADFAVNSREQLDNAKELAGDQHGSCKGNIMESSSIKSNDLRTNHNLDSFCTYKARLTTGADASISEGNSCHETTASRDKNENGLLPELMDGNTIEIDGEQDFFPLPVQEKRNGSVDGDQLPEPALIQFFTSPTACRLGTDSSLLSSTSNKPVTGSLKANTYALNNVSPTAATQIPGSPTSSHLDDSQIPAEHQVLDVCRVGTNHFPALFHQDFRDYQDCGRLLLQTNAAMQWVSDAAFLAQKTLTIPPEFSSISSLGSLTTTQTQSTRNSSGACPASSIGCTPVCSFTEDGNILLKRETRPDLNLEKRKQQLETGKKGPERNMLDALQVKGGISNSFETNEAAEISLSRNNSSCISRERADDSLSSDTETSTCHSSPRESLPVNLEPKIPGAAVEKSPTLLSQSKVTTVNGCYEVSDHGAEVRELGLSQHPKPIDNFEMFPYVYYLPPPWLPLQATYSPFQPRPDWTGSFHGSSDLESTTENTEASFLRVGRTLLPRIPVSALEDVGASEGAEMRDLEADILRGDLSTNLYHLQVGHFLKSPYGLPFTSSGSLASKYNQRHHPWEGPGRPMATNMNNTPNVLNHGRRFLLATPPPGNNAQNTFALANGYLGEESSRSRKGTGPYFPNWRHNSYTGRQHTGAARGQRQVNGLDRWDSKNYEVTRGAVGLDRRDPNNHEGTQVFVPNYASAGRGRLHRKSNHKLERNSVEVKAREKCWDMLQGESLQSNSLHILPTKSSGIVSSNPLYSAKAGTDTNCCLLGKKTGVEMLPHATNIPSTFPVMVHSDTNCGTFATEKLAFGSFGSELVVTRGGSGKDATSVIGHTECNHHGTKHHEHTQATDRCSRKYFSQNHQESSLQTSYELKEEDFPPLSCGQHGRSTSFRAPRNSANQQPDYQACAVGPTS